jgi:hypothetical protein
MVIKQEPCKQMEKKCNRCQKTQLIDEFKNIKNNKETTTCLTCRTKNKNIKPQINNVLQNNTKKCTRCKKHKSDNDFISKKNNKITKMCLKCRDNSKKYDIRTITVKNSPKYNDNGEKLCTRCCIYKNIESRYSTCESCRNYNLKFLDRNNPRYSRNKLVNVYINLKKDKKCIDCGIDDYKILEFDHFRDKINCVRKMTNEIDMINESKKCDIRCVRCHRIKTFQNKIESINSYIYIARNYVDKIKKEIGKCEICEWFDEDNLYCLDFDHINREDKSENISRLVSIGSNINKIKDEIKKCRLLCANCHRTHTNNQMNYNSYENVNY